MEVKYMRKANANNNIGSLRIGVLGIGYVGLVTATCLAELGFEVICYDINKEKINDLIVGEKCPIYEPELMELIRNNANHLHFTDEPSKCIMWSDIIFICVGTPSTETGTVNMEYIKSSCELISKYAKDAGKIIVMKSTVPIGTHKYVADLIGFNSYVYNPEFLREGAAVKDFLYPDRVVVGCSDSNGKKAMQEIYKGFPNVMFVSIESAEIIKYASNAMLATRIAFMNEIAQLCNKTGANVMEVALGVGSDKRIGPQFLVAGPGYGGSCFPKDTRALAHSMKLFGINDPIVEAVIESNEKHKSYMFNFVRDAIGSYKGKKVAVLGLAFKAGTDDTRDSASLYLIDRLALDGANIFVNDPVATHPLVNTYPITETLMDADIVFVMTEWNEYKDIPFLRFLKPGAIIADCRNLFDRKQIESLGLRYFGMGR